MSTTQQPTTGVPAGAPAQRLFADLPTELATTRRVLERVPDGRFDWAPHAKSMTLGRLATHVAELPRFGVVIFEGDELDFATSGYTPSTAGTTAELLATFDDLAAAMQRAVGAATWEDLDRPWRLRAGPQVFLEGPKGVLVRTLAMSHIVHHRAQLGVYLRLLGLPVPSVYGPTADEQ